MTYKKDALRLIFINHFYVIARSFFQIKPDGGIQI